MSRPIKLRAWTGDKFIYLEIAHGGQGKGGIKLDPGVYGHLEPWQQFTGLTDKNGKEIFEGDIVQCYEYEADAHANNPTYKDAVVFHRGAFILDKPGFAVAEYDDKENSFSIEVLGNIHENPELLEEHHG